MSALAPPEPLARAKETRTAAEYLVSYGKSGAFGRFAVDEPLKLLRGDSVVVHTPRGVELGTVLCAATSSHARLLTSSAAGRLVRKASAADQAVATMLAERGRQILGAGARLTRELALPLQVLDVEVLLEGGRAVLQYLGPADADIAPLADALADALGDAHLLVLFENLAVP